MKSPRTRQSARAIIGHLKAIELFRDIPAGHAFFEQFSFVDEELLPELKIMVNRAAQDGIESLQPDQREDAHSPPAVPATRYGE